ARRHRVVLTAAVLLNGLILAGCETGGISDKLGEMGDAVVDMIPGGGKKKLPGDRKPVFPEGVPGVAQGVPPELVKGNQPPPATRRDQGPGPRKPGASQAKPQKKEGAGPEPPPPAAGPAGARRVAGPATAAAAGRPMAGATDAAGTGRHRLAGASTNAAGRAD